jgi:NAD/NADP transhydrogenase beta subunit
MITSTVYLVICAILSILVLVGISMMSKVKTAVAGNILSAISVFVGILITLLYNEIISVASIYIYMLAGVIVGSMFAVRVKMIEMPQLVALLNGVGGLASALVGILTLLGIGQAPEQEYPIFSNVTAVLAIVVGIVTLVGSLVAAGKLHKLLSQRPVIWKNHSAILNFSLIILLVTVVYSAFIGDIIDPSTDITIILFLSIGISTLFGYAFAIRVGGADMPITISLLNSLSGVAGAIAGMAISDILLVSVGGIVGASGLFLTQIMCRSMNRSLMDILTGKTSVAGKKTEKTQAVAAKPKKEEKVETKQTSSENVLQNAKSVIIVPGYGMALAQAQHLVRQLADKLESKGAQVRYAIHPVAGRMPGHMNVLLAEADVSYEQLYEMDAINDDFKNTDAVIVIGANDVLNPAARDAVDTPIYGMPVLNVDQAKNVFICNYDLNPGYAGVDNPLYKKEKGVHLLLGDAKESVNKLISMLDSKPSQTAATEIQKNNSADVLQNAKSVIIVPGYGMALAQAQHLVRQLADKLESKGAKVRYAIHPVAGRMPGHMNVLLAEADVSYEQLYEMDAINDDFKNTDAVIVIGANDVLNPAARDAVDTPIYGMPVLNVDQAKEIFICNFDLNPGYAGVDNPLYKKEKGVHLLLGDAKDSVNRLISMLDSKPSQTAATEIQKNNSADVLQNAKSVIIVPGYGMALAQAQHLVRQLADKLESKGAKVRYAIHPVAGRMPGHMNVLLAEADVSYEQLYEMDAINDDFKNTDAVIVIGANDVLNPAARDAVDTPIYGMPVLNVDQAKEIFICNFDLNPGYAGVDNPLYKKEKGVHLLLGDAKESVNKLIAMLDSKTSQTSTIETKKDNSADVLQNAKSVIIVPGYGMALAQAQHLVRQLADKLESKGAKVRYAIHPVAGRMPGHMNVLLAEADVSYEQLYEMDAINDDFKNTDAVIVIGANDVLNPAARDAVDTPIYGMPVLNVDQAKEIFICNFDLNPGYAGVDNPLYKKEKGVHLLLGDAKESVQKLIDML